MGDLRGANLSGADLRGGELAGADLKDADLDEEHLAGVHATDVDLTTAHVAGDSLQVGQPSASRLLTTLDDGSLPSARDKSNTGFPC